MNTENVAYNQHFKKMMSNMRVPIHFPNRITRIIGC